MKALRIPVPLVALLFALFCQWANHPCLAQSLKYVPESTSVAIQFRAKAAMAEPAMMFLPKELIDVFGKKELGLDLMQLDRLLLVVDKLESFQTPEPPGLAIIAEFATPQTMGGRMTEEIQSVNDNGQTVWRIDQEMELRQINPQTLVMGMPEFVAEVLTANNQTSTVAKGLLAADSAEQLTIIVDMASMQPALEEVLPPEDQIQAPFQGLVEIPQLISQITLRHSWKEKGRSLLRLEADSAANADKLERSLRSSINSFRTVAVPALLNEMQLPDEDYQQAMVAFIDRLAEEFKNGIKNSRAGNGLVIDLSKNQQFSSTAVIGTLVGLLLPAFQRVREAARRTDSQNNIRMQMLAILNYHDAMNRLPGQAITDTAGKPLLSWRVAILPYLDEGQLYSEFHLDEPWDSEHNLKLLDRMPQVYRNAAIDLGNQTVYLAVTGKGTGFEAGKKIGIRDILDGTSYAIGIVEASPASAVPWTKPEDWTYQPGQEKAGLGGIRPDGFLAVFFDGSSRLIANSVDNDFLRKLFLINDGEVIGDLDR
ncbi:MAG: DUF1559 domain-containing protein [Planctomycetota bacterium]